MALAKLGLWGENEAARYLAGQGLKIIDRHFQTRWGEIDVIARLDDTWIFVEVKTRTASQEPSAADSITLSKQKKMINAALSYMKKYRLEGENMRFDAILIEAGKIEWIPGAFDAAGTAFTL